MIGMRRTAQQLVLHIGRHKTGTTALQYNFVQNREALTQAGVHYPETGRDWVAHHPVANRLVNLRGSSDFPENDDLLSRLLEEIRTCGKNTVLISSEGFQRCDPEIVRDVFGDFDVTVIVYLRDQLSYLQSSYLQAIHAEKYSGTIEEYEEDIFYCDYLEFITAWKNAFSPEQIIARIFSRDFLKSGDILDDFFLSVLGEKLGIEVEFNKEMLEPAARNTSLKGKAIAFKKRLNSVIESENYYFADLYKALGRHSAGIAGSDNLVSRKLSRKLKLKYKRSNRKVLRDLSMPVSLLDFKKVDAHQTVPWLGAAEFHDVLMQLVGINESCSALLADCYSVEILPSNGGWRLAFSRNIRVDSLPFVRISKGGRRLRLDEAGSPGENGYIVRCDVFDPRMDAVLLEFDSGKSVDILKIVKD